MTDETTVVEVRHGRNHARLELYVRSGALAMCAHVRSDDPEGSFWHRDDRLDLQLTLNAPADCRLGGVSTSWDLDAPGRCDGPFIQFARWVERNLIGDDGGQPFDRDGGRVEDNQLGQLCRTAAVGAVRQCDPSARSLALAFHHGARLFVYGSLVEDWWRRVEQALGICPGLFVLSSMVPGLRTRVTDEIRQGLKLASVVRDIAGAVGARNRNAVALIRHAPRELRPDDLLALVREPGVDINDMPSAERDLKTWYSWCAAAARGMRPLVGFVSKHALELSGMRGLDPSSLFREISDWSTETRAPLPSRRSSPIHVFAAIDRWHESLWSSSQDPATPLPLCPTASVPTVGISARPLTTVGELIEEGRRMHHCVGIGAERALTGARAFFHAIVCSEPVTIEVGRGLAGWFLVEASGFANRPPRDPLTIIRWVATLRP